MEQVLFSTTMLASVLGGVVALLAPCCVSVMLPAFFAATFRRRAQIVAMTLVFGAGVGTIILPIALGAAFVSRLLQGGHFWIFSLVGLAMVAVGVATLGGWKFMLPMPSRSGGGTGVGSVYLLGIFSGAASACCAPVLAGVAALAGAAASIPAAMAVGVAYVFGMVAPLSVIALAWDRYDWGNARLLTAPRYRVWPRSKKRVSLATLMSGLLMVGMGILTIVLAVRGPGMATSGWEVQVTAFLSHWSVVLQRTLSVIPGWVFTVLLAAALVGLVWVGLRSRGRRSRPVGLAPADPTPTEPEPASADAELVPAGGSGSPVVHAERGE